MDIAIQRLSSRLGHHFQNPALLQQALTHRSASSHNNERLEFLGDAVLGMIMAEYLHNHFDQADEGTLSRLRAQLVKGESLAQVARTLGVGECLRLGSGEMKSGGHRRKSILADALEAMIGAIYLDAGMAACRQSVIAWFGERLASLSPDAVEKDAKTCLQEYLQSRGEAVPRYRVVTTAGSPHNRIFTVHCEVDLLAMPVSGTGSSRRKAEQDAASKVLELLHV